MAKKLQEVHAQRYEAKLPEAWALARFDDVSDVTDYVANGSFASLKANVTYKDEPDFAILVRFTDHVKGWNGKYKFVDEHAYNFLRKSTVDPGDLVISNVGDPGKAFIVPNLGKPMTLGPNSVLVKPKDGLNNKFLAYFFKSGWGQELFTQITTGTAQKKFNKTGLRSTYIPIPPPEQQKRIVAKIEELFSHIDAAIEALNKARQLLKQYRQTVLKAAVTGELTKEWRKANKDKLEHVSQLLERINTEREHEFKRKLDAWEEELAHWKSTGEMNKKPSKPKNPKVIEPISDCEMNSLEDLPKGWIWVRLGNLTVDVFDGPFGSNLKSSDYVNQGIRVIRLENIGNLEFKDDKESFITLGKYEQLKKHTVRNGDLIFSSFVAEGTRVVILPKHIEIAINKADCFCIRCYGSSIFNNYLSLFLATNSAYKRLENQVHGATRPRINTTQLKTIEIPICSIEEQMEAARILHLKFDAIDRLKNEIDRNLLIAGQSKKSILGSAFLGSLNE